MMLRASRAARGAARWRSGPCRRAGKKTRYTKSLCKVVPLLYLIGVLNNCSGARRMETSMRSPGISISATRENTANGVGAMCCGRFLRVWQVTIVRVAPTASFPIQSNRAIAAFYRTELAI